MIKLSKTHLNTIKQNKKKIVCCECDDETCDYKTCSSCEVTTCSECKTYYRIEGERKFTLRSRNQKKYYCE